MTTKTYNTIQTTAKRMSASGLEITITSSYSRYPTYDGFTDSERTEPFVVRFLKRVAMSDGHLIASEGDIGFVWRTKTLATDFQASALGPVSINGFTRGGRQVVRWHSDEEAAREVETVRNPDGTVMRAKDHPEYEAARERYAFMMSY
jgi:hypothetical protein